MKYSKLSRRMFLEGAGKTSLAIPFLSSLAGQDAKAAEPKMKFIQVSSDLCLPRVTSTPGYYDHQAGRFISININTPSDIPFTQADADTRYRSLAAVASRYGKVSHIFDEKWNPYLNKINIIANSHGYTKDDLHEVSNPHHNSCMATTASGMKGGNFSLPISDYSNDVILEKSLYGALRPRIPVLRVFLDGGEYNHAYETNSYDVSRPGTKIIGNSKLRELYDQLINSGGRSGSGAGSLGSSRDQLTVDLVLEDYKRIAGSRRISSTDRSRLTLAMDMWNDFLKNLQPSSGQPTLSCTFPEPTNSTNGRLKHQQAMKLAALALACGQTRIVSYSLMDLSDAPIGLTALGNDEHGAHHNSLSPANNGMFMTDMAKWRADRMAEFLKILTETPDENGGSIFNSTVLQWTHEYSDHDHVLAGYVSLFASGATNKFTLGHHVNAGGAPINRLHITSLKAMGLTDSQIEIAGKPGFGQYASGMPYSDIDIENNRNLPNGQLKPYWRSDFSFKGEGQELMPNATLYSYFRGDRFFTSAEKRKPFYFLKV